MSPLSKSIVIPVPYVRSFAIAALMGTTLLATPLTAAPRDQTAVGTAEAKAETVDQRISSLHADLEITAGEEMDWKNVAQAMRDNAATMQKLVAEKTAGDPQAMTAVDDLKVYGQFAQAHVDGLKNLTASFETLYGSMPDAQKKVADQVFQNHHREGATHS